MVPTDSALTKTAAAHRRFGERWLLGGYAISAALTGVAVALGSLPNISGPLGPASPTVLACLGVALVLSLGLAAMLGWRMLKLMGAQARDAGARLHLRFVALFSLAAVAPAVIVALFFGVLVTRGVDNWFSARVQAVVENSATVARSYVAEQEDFIGRHVAAMASQLDAAAPELARRPAAFDGYLAQLAADNGFSGAYLIDRKGSVIARAGHTALIMPPSTTFRSADEGVVSVGAFESADQLRALFRLPGFSAAYLYAIRPVDRGIFRHLRETEASLAGYRIAKQGRARIRAAFALSYVQTVMLVLVGAVWLGMSAANGIATPVARLVQAAERVATGDLTARVDAERDPAEIAVLSRAFNRMTHDLGEQREALRKAHEEGETRRLFTEAVLLGVSAGVIGLDLEGRILALNRQATRLLGLDATADRNRPLAAVAPELAATAKAARDSEIDIEEDIDVKRGGETRRLRVRASAGTGGVVLTFDDITRLVAAQRSAAWRDVARRIAHEIKNPLTPIQLSAERLRRKYRREIVTEPEVFDRCTDTIIRQVGDIGRMVDEFSAFARMPAPRFAENDAAELLRAAVFAQRVADPEVEVDVVEPGGVVRLTCDGRIVSQALANVLKNAGEAIAVRRALSAEPQGRIVARLVEDPKAVRFEIDDNGPGLPADREGLTEPYVTTREKGAGLGLAIVKRILEDHGGQLELVDGPCWGKTHDGAPRQGARVILRFPPPDTKRAVAAAEPREGRIRA